jgi:peroxiredoxin
MKKSREGWRRWLLVALELMLAVAIVYSILAWRARDMLATGDSVEAPGLALERLNGTRFDLADYAGRPVLVYFFAPWCRVCAMSAPNLRHLDRFAEDDLAIVVVALDWPTREDVHRFAQHSGLDDDILLGTAATAAAWQVPGFPSYYALDREHRVRFRDFGYTTTAGLLWRTWAAGQASARIPGTTNAAGTRSGEGPVASLSRPVP